MINNNFYFLFFKIFLKINLKFTINFFLRYLFFMEEEFYEKKTKTLAPPVFIKGGKYDPISVCLKIIKFRKIS